MVRFRVLMPVATSDQQGGELLDWKPAGFLWGEVKKRRARYGSDLGKVKKSELEIVLKDAAGLALKSGWKLQNEKQDFVIMDLWGHGETGAIVRAHSGDNHAV